MEFERSIFRMHERLLLSRSCPKLATVVQRSFCALFVWLLLGFVVYHKQYVNSSDILVHAIEEQLLTQNKDSEYQRLSYSAKSDKFIFCNKVTYERNDTESLVHEVVTKTNDTEAQAKNMTNDELITEINFVPCEFFRDELFSVVVVREA